MIDLLGWFDQQVQNVYRFLTNSLGIPVETLLGLSLLGVGVGAYLLLTSREVELLVEEAKGKEK